MRTRIQLFALFCILLLRPSTAQGQATQISAPDDDYLLEITQEWGRELALGDLRTRPMAPGDLELPISVGDTLSEESTRRYQAEARRRCGEPEGDELSSATVITVDTVALRPLPRSIDFAGVWREAVDAGLLQLPPRIERTWMMMDGHTFVAEVRCGNEYRASVIELTISPETEADRRVQRVDEVVRRMLLPRQ